MIPRTSESILRFTRNMYIVPFRRTSPRAVQLTNWLSQGEQWTHTQTNSCLFISFSFFFFSIFSSFFPPPTVTSGYFLTIYSVCLALITSCWRNAEVIVDSMESWNFSLGFGQSLLFSLIWVSVFFFFLFLFCKKSNEKANFIANLLSI